MAQASQPNPLEYLGQDPPNITAYEDFALGAVAAIATATEIDMRFFSTGFVIVENSGTDVTITWYVSHKKGGDYFAYTDGAGSPVTTTIVKNEAVPLPTALAGAHWVKAIGNAGGSILNITLSE